MQSVLCLQFIKDLLSVRGLLVTLFVMLCLNLLNVESGQCTVWSLLLTGVI